MLMVLRQKTFIVATLASTLVGTFTASMGLWERVSDKREQHRQRQRDTKQDGEIKQLREQFEKAQEAADGRQKEIDRLKNGGGRGRDEVGGNFERDSMMIQRMYDDMYGRMGRRFAQGDGMYPSSPMLRCTVIKSFQRSSRISSKLKLSRSSKLSSTSSKML